MSTLGNIIWFIFIGLGTAIGWLFAGIICCITVIGIPFGMQCFKFAKLSLWPFGKEIQNGDGKGSTIGNIIWVVFFGIWMAISYALAGIIFYITIIGIPFGKQCMKLAKLSLSPFGAEIV